MRSLNTSLKLHFENILYLLGLVVPASNLDFMDHDFVWSFGVFCLFVCFFKQSHLICSMKSPCATLVCLHFVMHCTPWLKVVSHYFIFRKLDLVITSVLKKRKKKRRPFLHPSRRSFIRVIHQVQVQLQAGTT